jgi:glutamine synthetase
VAQKDIDLYREMGVMNQKEILARYDIELEDYAMRIQIDSRLLGDIARNHVIPTAIRYQNILIKNVRGLKEIFAEDFEQHSKEQITIIKEISRHIESINADIDAMIDERRKANKLEDSEEKAFAYCDEVRPYFDKIRYHCDKLELLIDDELWPLTKYRELLFTR